MYALDIDKVYINYIMFSYLMLVSDIHRKSASVYIELTSSYFIFRTM